jgi:hypothetical protein
MRTRIALPRFLLRAACPVPENGQAPFRQGTERGEETKTAEETDMNFPTKAIAGALAAANGPRV